MMFGWRFWCKRAPGPLGVRGETLAAKHLNFAVNGMAARKTYPGIDALSLLGGLANSRIRANSFARLAWRNTRPANT